jgi:hypothetical protein
MKSRHEVEKFLEEIRVKYDSGVLSLYYLNDREKNAQALLDLEIPPNKRTEIIMTLKPEDFYRIEEGIYLERYEMYAFGKTLKGIEYISKFLSQNAASFVYHFTKLNSRLIILSNSIYSCFALPSNH